MTWETETKTYMDIKPRPKTRLESFERWMNHMTVVFNSGHGKKIEVKYE